MQVNENYYVVFRIPEKQTGWTAPWYTVGGAEPTKEKAMSKLSENPCYFVKGIKVHCFVVTIKWINEWGPKIAPKYSGYHWQDFQCEFCSKK